MDCCAVTFVSTYTECSHSPTSTIHGCPTPQNCSKPHLTEIKLSINGRFCPSCFLTYPDPRTTPTHNRTTAEFQVPTPPGVEFDREAQKEAKEIASILSGRELYSFVKEIRRAKAGHQKFGRAVFKALSRVLWLLSCRFWWRVDRGDSPSLLEKMLILALEDIHNRDEEFEAMVCYYPPRPSQYFRHFPPFSIAPVQDQSEVCQICKNPFGQPNTDGTGPGEHAVVVEDCGGRHVFGNECLLLWMDHSLTCPMDRQPLLRGIQSFEGYYEFLDHELERKADERPTPGWLIRVFHGIDPKTLADPDLIFPDYSPPQGA